jgi:hypothetical protein
MPVLGLKRGSVNLERRALLFRPQETDMFFFIVCQRTNTDVSLLLVANVASEIGIVAKKGMENGKLSKFQKEQRDHAFE